MEKKLSQFAAGFAIALILIGGFCGFMMVDLSTGRYMPGRFGSMFTISAVDAQGVVFSAMGEERYIQAPLQLVDPQVFLGLRSILPAEWQVASGLGGYLHRYLADTFNEDTGEEAGE